jgi:hypothetical protein
MSSAPAIRQGRRSRATNWWLVAAGLLLVIGANAHLLHVATTFAPGCVAHVEPGEGGVHIPGEVGRRFRNEVGH